MLERFYILHLVILDPPLDPVTTDSKEKSALGALIRRHLPGGICIRQQKKHDIKNKESMRVQENSKFRLSYLIGRDRWLLQTEQTKGEAYDHGLHRLSGYCIYSEIARSFGIFA